jgi:hypothetical protein
MSHLMTYMSQKYVIYAIHVSKKMLYMQYMYAIYAIYMLYMQYMYAMYIAFRMCVSSETHICRISDRDKAYDDHVMNHHYVVNHVKKHTIIVIMRITGGPCESCDRMRYDVSHVITNIYDTHTHAYI